MQRKRPNLRYTMTLSLALAGLTTAGGVLLYRAEQAHGQDSPADIPQPDPRELLPVQHPPQNAVTAVL
jgi:hypothetical protein